MQSARLGWGFGFGVFFGIILTVLAISPASRSPKVSQAQKTRQQANIAINHATKTRLPAVPIIDYELLAVLQSATDPFGDSTIIAPDASDPFQKTPV